MGASPSNQRSQEEVSTQEKACIEFHEELVQPEKVFDEHALQVHQVLLQKVLLQLKKKAYRKVHNEEMKQAAQKAHQKAQQNAQRILKERALQKVQMQAKMHAQLQTLLRLQDLKKLVEQQGLKMKVHQELTQQTVA